MALRRFHAILVHNLGSNSIVTSKYKKYHTPVKITYRIPTEMYAYVEVEAEVGKTNPTPKEIRADYELYVEAFKPTPVNSLPDKEFNSFIDEMLKTKKIVNGQEAYEKMSPQQKDIIQSVKRSFKRLGN